ncbi:hypothetical protein Dimus_019250 [Dionaea muscipula]
MEPTSSSSSSSRKKKMIVSSSAPSIPWKDMFRSASFRQPHSDPFCARQSSSSTSEDQAAQLVPHSSNSLIGSTPPRSFSMDHNREGSRISSIQPNHDPSSPPSFRRYSSLCPPSISNVESPSTEDHPAMILVKSSSLASSSDIQVADTPPALELEPNQETSHQLIEDDLLVVGNNHVSVSPPEDSPVDPDPPVLVAATSTHDNNITVLESLESSTLPRDPHHIRIALYITMAQAGLAIIVVIFYVAYRLLEEYLRPIIWAVVCSVPLRGIQDTLVEFWSEPLRSGGLTEAALAVPVAVMKVLVGTVVDARDVYCWISYGKRLEDHSRALSQGGSGFLKLVRRLLSFGVFVLAYEQFGATATFAVLGMGLLMFSSNLNLSQTRMLAFTSTRSDDHDDEQGGIKVSTFVARWILSRLKTIVAMGLIVGTIVGLLAGMIFLTYRTGVEGKDAMVSIRSHLAESHYAENLGLLKGWIMMDGNQVLEVVDRYTDECYEALWLQVDSLGAKYNLTDFIQLMKQLVIAPPGPANSNSQETRHYYLHRLRNLKSVLTEVLFNKEEEEGGVAVEKAKCFVAQGVHLSLEALANSRFILAELLLSIRHSMVSVAAGILHLFLQMTLFFWVLYYLLTSEASASGVTEQVVKMLPIKISGAARNKCVDALNHAVSDVLLATAEIAFFQAIFTWLICRLYSVHFVYMSTMLAFIGSLLPILPPWLPTVPAALQLAFDGKYTRAISFCVTHLVLMDYGVSEITDDIPGYSAYLTGVSIIGGITLFPSAFEVN